MSDSDRRSGIRRFYDKMPIPASQTDEGKERLAVYHYALGQFIDCFAAPTG